MTNLKIWVFWEIIVISPIVGVLLADLIRCIKISLKKYCYQNTDNDKQPPENVTNNDLCCIKGHRLQPPHQQESDSQGNTNYYAPGFPVILQPVAFLLTNYARIIKRLTAKCNRIYHFVASRGENDKR